MNKVANLHLFSIQPAFIEYMNEDVTLYLVAAPDSFVG